MLKIIHFNEDLDGKEPIRIYTNNDDKMNDGTFEIMIMHIKAVSNFGNFRYIIIILIMIP